MKKFWRSAMGKRILTKERKLLVAMCLAAFLLIIPSVRADTNIDNCTTLDTPGETYLLTADIGTINASSDTYNCMDVQADDVILDCQNHLIIDNNTDLGGVTLIYSTFDNFTLENCNLYGVFDYSGIIIGNATMINNNITNITTNNFQVTLYELNYNNSFNNSIPKFSTSFAEYEFIYWNDSQKGNYWTNFDKTGWSDNCTCQPNSNSYYGGICAEPYILNSMENYSCSGNLIQTDCFNLYSENQTVCEAHQECTWVGSCFNITNSYPGIDSCEDFDKDALITLNKTCENYNCTTNQNWINTTDYLPLCVAEQECTPSWVCGNWSQCVDGYQSRECTDSNQCGDNRTKPAESQACEMPLPNATFNITSNCCPISAFFCEGNTTLVQMWNTSQGYSYAYVACPNGCDNVTNSCTPLPYQQSLWVILVIVIIALIILLIAWRLLR